MSKEMQNLKKRNVTANRLSPYSLPKPISDSYSIFFLSFSGKKDCDRIDSFSTYVLTSNISLSYYFRLFVYLSLHTCQHQTSLYLTSFVCLSVCLDIRVNIKHLSLSLSYYFRFSVCLSVCQIDSIIFPP